MKNILLSLIFISFSFELHSAVQQTTITRADSSQAIVYLTTPESSSETFPLVVFIDGSFKNSVKNNFVFLSLLFNAKNIGVAAIEKRGITEKAIDREELLEHDRFEERLADYVQFIEELKFIAPNWNGKLIFMGSSEGGKMAPKLTLQFADHTLGTILIGSGGGLSFAEEIKYQIQTAFGDSEEEIELKFAEILNEPNSLQEYHGSTYRWLSSHLLYDPLPDLLNIQTPLLMIHGVKDTDIPVESADLIHATFASSEKTNFEYLRFDDLGHSIGNRIDIFLLLRDWVVNQLMECEPQAA